MAESTSVERCWPSGKAVSANRREREWQLHSCCRKGKKMEGFLWSTAALSRKGGQGVYKERARDEEAARKEPAPHSCLREGEHKHRRYHILNAEHFTEAKGHFPPKGEGSLNRGSKLGQLVFISFSPRALRRL